MIFIFSGPHMPIGNIWSGILFRHDDSIFVALAETCKLQRKENLFLFITQDDDVLTNIDYELGERER